METSTLDDKAILAFVHAKAHSERLPEKNMLPLGGIPLFMHAVRAAQQSRYVTAVVVDSDSEAILRCANEAGAWMLRRPKHLATNTTTGDDLAYNQVCWAKPTKFRRLVHVLPTSPFIRPETIDRAIEMAVENDVDSVAGVFTDQLYTWTDGRPDYRQNGKLPNSQDLPATTWETTGLYVMRTSYVLTHRRRVNPEFCLLYPLSRIEAIDINTQDDYEFAQVVWRGLHGNRHDKE